MACQEEFFASLTPSSIEPTPMPDLAIAAIDAPLRACFVEALEGVGGRLGNGNELDDVKQRAAELVGQTSRSCRW